MYSSTSLQIRLKDNCHNSADLTNVGMLSEFCMGRVSHSNDTLEALQMHLEVKGTTALKCHQCKFTSVAAKKLSAEGT